MAIKKDSIDTDRAMAVFDLTDDDVIQAMKAIGGYLGKGFPGSVHTGTAACP